MTSDDVIMTSSEETVIDEEGEMIGVVVVGEGSCGNRDDWVRKNSSSEMVEETVGEAEMAGVVSIAEGLKGKRMVKIGEDESVGMIESLWDGVIAN